MSLDAANMAMEYAGYKAEIRLRRDMPTGPVNRVADNQLAKQLLGVGAENSVPGRFEKDDGLVFRK